MKSEERVQVLIIGERYIETQRFENRGLVPVFIDLPQLRDNKLFDFAKAVLFCMPSGKFREISVYFQNHFQEACQRGLLTAVYTDKPIRISSLQDAIYDNLPVCDRVSQHDWDQWIGSLTWIYFTDSKENMLQRLSLHNPGPSVGNIEIKFLGEEPGLSREQETLIKRAFHDSSSISIRSLAGGKTAKGAFCVFSTLKDQQYALSPMPYFAKLDFAFRINEEMNHYKDFAEHFIPFHLRPSLNVSRSLLALHEGILVGNFVENAVSLREALRTGQGVGTIFSLFETTLRGLRSQTVASGDKPGVIESFLMSKVRAEEVETNFPKRIKVLKNHGKLTRPMKIQQGLVALAQTIRTREGPYHGDMHYSNVMVRNRDAVLIDFASMKGFGPLSADPLVLEVSLLFGTDVNDDPKSYYRWSSFVDYVYEKPLEPPIDNGRFHQFSWLLQAVREIRHVVSCCRLTESEVLIVLTGCLLRFGRNGSLPFKDEQLNELAEKRRSYALVTAYNIYERLN